MTNALATTPEEAALAVEAAIESAIGKRMDNSPEANAFRLVQRQAAMLSSSTLVPKDFQGNASNCAIGLNIAARLGADAFMVIQNIDIIHGRPSFRATFLIAMVNASGRFSPLQFKMTGEGSTRSCIAYARTKDGETVEGPEITMVMAQAEGWSTKPGSKWKTMPELMLRYRAAAFFARIYAPDITLGMQTSEEAQDMSQEPRQASGRVVGSDARNPYDVAAESVIEDPQPTGDSAHESPVEVSEEAERAQLVEYIKMFLSNSGSKMTEFAPKCREVGLLEAGVQLPQAPINDLRIIHENRLAIHEGTFRKEWA